VATNSVGLAGTASRHSILLVDDNPGMIQLMAKMLEGEGHLRFATNGPAALLQLQQTVPDLVLLDAEMPGMNGFELCALMQADPCLAEVPVIFVTSHNDQASELKGLSLGAVDFIAKPISEPLLKARVKTQLRVKHLTDQLRQLATVDALTGLLNRRGMDDALAREWGLATRQRTPISVLMVDVDHFKLFNDCYGHLVGDDCLRQVSAALREGCQRPGDLVARFGGEEFAVVLPGTPAVGAQHLAQQLLQQVSRLKIGHRDSPTAPYVTVSIGISTWQPPSPQSAQPTGEDGPVWRASQLVDAADVALYRAKHGGRHQAWWLSLEDLAFPDRAQATHLDRSA
jgi:diguanylate cyclase (GGDEF)-like protein